MKLKRYQFKIVGASPLLMNSSMNMVNNTGKVGKKVIPTAEEECKSKEYKDKKGRYYIPTSCFRNAILYACSGKRVNKRSAKAVLQSAIFPGEEDFVLCNPSSNKPLGSYQIDTRPAVIQKARIMRRRPRFEDWGGTLTLDIDTDITTPEVIEEQLAEAGVISGVGDFRIQKGGTFGRFTASLVK